MRNLMLDNISLEKKRGEHESRRRNCNSGSRDHFLVCGSVRAQGIEVTELITKGESIEKGKCRVDVCLSDRIGVGHGHLA